MMVCWDTVGPQEDAFVISSSRPFLSERMLTGDRLVMKRIAGDVGIWNDESSIGTEEGHGVAQGLHVLLIAIGTAVKGNVTWELRRRSFSFMKRRKRKKHTVRFPQKHQSKSMSSEMTWQCDQAGNGQQIVERE